MVGLQWWSPTSKPITFLSTTFTSYDLWLLRSTSAVPRPTSNDSSHDSGGPSAASTPSLISPVDVMERNTCLHVASGHVRPPLVACVLRHCLLGITLIFFSKWWSDYHQGFDRFVLHGGVTRQPLGMNSKILLRRRFDLVGRR
uniref:Uncharacterized protein n=1 Tax=Helianthus annuus TaxID=4232 RepID=A0A251SXF8_HELAN